MNTSNWEHKRQRILATLSVVMVGLVWAVDMQILPELSLFVFNLLPIGVMAWFVGGRAAYILSAMSVVLWLLSDIVFSKPWFATKLLLYVNVSLKASLFLGSAYLLSELRRSLDTLALRNRELAEANELKTTFLGMASHDLRSPLSAIQLMAEVLHEQVEAREQGSEGLGRGLDTISEAGIRMQRMLDNYLDYARIESGGFTARPRSFDPAQWLVKTAETARPLAQKRQVELACVTRTTSEWRADPDLLELALANMISNALKYTPTGSTVTVEAASDSGTALLRVSDEGPGFGTHAAVAFEKFRRGRKQHGGEKSTGLGLYIVRKVAEAHGGTATLSDLPGRGACVELHIPQPLP